MTLRAAAISFGCALLGVLLVMLAVRRATRPLHQLALSAQCIAQGEYSRRAAIHSRDEVGALARDFNTMAEAVEAKVGALTAASERQRAFVNAMSHEMRTPVTSIVGYAETLLTTDMPREVQEEALLQVHAQSQWLERLSQKMLGLLVIEKGIEAKPVNVRELLDAVYEATRKLMEERQTPLVIECGVDTLPLDADLMTSALINLVDNASKASPKGAAVRLSADESGFCVQDQGIGILPADHENVTQPFFTGNTSRSKRQGGVGLGLAIVQRVAQAHGAELKIESAIGQGTKMRLEFGGNKTFANR
jgi:signal transduction histidine kinase